MQLRPIRHALILAGAVLLAACQGTVGTMEDDPPRPPAEGESASGAAASGTGDDSVSGTGTTTGAGETGSASGGAFQGHPLDDPDGALTGRTVYFEFDSSDIQESQRAIVEAHAHYLAEHPGAQITLEGHADERGSREYNIGLGERRAVAVRRLMTLLGATTPQIRTISYGEERPAADGHDESAWQLNRRVDIVYRVRE